MRMHKPFAFLLAAVLLATATAPYKPGAPATGHPGAGASGLWAATVRLSEADEAPKKSVDPATLTVIDSAGKEKKLKTWTFTQGVRHLAWLAPAAEDKEPAPPKDGKPVRAPRLKEPPAVGPEALEFREENSTHFVNGILTLIPLDRLRGLDYDAAMETVTARAATGDKTDETLTGSTKFRNINKIKLEAEVDKGDLGIAKTIYEGGVATRGIKGLRFPSARPVAPPKGRAATVTILDKENKTAMPVTDLQVLYQTTNGEKLLSLLMFQKTLKIDVSKIKKIVANEGNGQEFVWQVFLKDGDDENLTLLQTIQHEGKELTLEGLLGKVPAGYKLFPVHTIGEVEFEPDAEK